MSRGESGNMTIYGDIYHSIHMSYCSDKGVCTYKALLSLTVMLAGYIILYICDLNHLQDTCSHSLAV